LLQSKRESCHTRIIANTHLPVAPNKTVHFCESIMSPRRRTRNEKIFYILSLLIVISMVIGLIAVAITPTGVGF
jgi:hypothetical protein